MKALKPLALALTLALVSVSAYAVERTTIGNSKVVVKTVTGTLADDTRELRLWDDIYHNELIETKDESATEIEFLDETKLTLGPNSTVVLDQFVYDPDPSNATFVMTATQGVFRFASGVLPKSAYKIHTPVATIGIRGTSLLISVVPVDPGSDSDEVAVSIRVDEGMATIVDCDGRVAVLDNPGESFEMVAGAGQHCQ